MEQTKYDVFISYRRKGGSEKAQLVKSELKQRGVEEERIFLDTHSLHDGDFEQKIKVAIEQSQCIVVIISKGCFDEVKETDFWYMEIKEALQQGKKVVPIFFDNILSFTGLAVPKELETLKKMNGVTYQHEYADMVFDRLLTFIGFQPQIQQYREKKGCLINLKYKGCLISLTLIVLLCIVVVPTSFFVFMPSTAPYPNKTDNGNVCYSPANKEQLLSKPASSALFFDTSGSMRGYVEAHDTRYWNAISVFEHLSDSTTVHLSGEVMSVTDFNKMINQKKIDWISQYELKDYIHSMIAQISGNKDVCILITDGILKETFRESHFDSDYNISRRSLLSHEISSILRNQDREVCALIVRYEAKFNGYYYCCDNSSTMLSNVDRPFFVIVLGKWNYINYIEHNLKEMYSVNHDNSSYTDYVIIGNLPSYHHIRLIPLEGISYKNNIMIIDKEYETKNITFNVDISVLPKHMRDEGYLRDNIILSIQNNNLSEKILEKDSYNINIVDSELRLRIKAKGLKNCKLLFKLQYNLPIWVEVKSTDNDADIATNHVTQDKTFNLKYLVAGFISLQDSPYIITQTIEFK